jgi:hypothetical protein
MNRRLIKNIRSSYVNLLKGICEEDPSYKFNKVLEPKLKYIVYNDILKYKKLNYNFSIVNLNEPVFLKLINRYELQNVNIDRDFNGYFEDYTVKYKSSGKVELEKIDYTINDRRSAEEIEKDREIFEKSDFKDLALSHLRDSALIEYNTKYVKKYMGNNKTEQNLDFVSELIENLQKSEKDESLYSQELKKQFSGYYSEKDKFITEKINSTDLYEYFQNNFPSHYNKLYSAVRSKDLGIARTLMTSLRKSLFDKLAHRSKKISADKTLIVLDIEVISKMRLNIENPNKENILDSKYNYSNIMKNSRSIINNEFLDYDTSIYNFNLPESKWNLDNKGYTQSHLIRVEYEQKNKFRNLFKDNYDTLKITDIDLTLKGNKHFQSKSNFE